MMDFKPRPGTFLPLLEYSQRRTATTQTAPRSPLALLEILARQSQQALPMFDLQTLSGLEPSPYAESLKGLKNAGYITIVGEAPEEMVRLTDSGENVVRLARPA